MKPLPRTLSRVALLLALGAGAAAAQPACEQLRLTAARLPLVFVDGFESGDTLPWAQAPVERFSAAATEDLVAETTLLGDASGDHLLTLRWLLPGDHLYQETSVPFTSDTVLPAFSHWRIVRVASRSMLALRPPARPRSEVMSSRRTLCSGRSSNSGC